MVEQEAWHSMSVEDVSRILKTDLKGLSEDESIGRLKEFGSNELVAEEKESPIRLLLEQFKNLLIVILIFATIFSAAIGEIVDAIVILAIVVASAALGFVQEYRAERVLEALKKMMSPTITVLRDGKRNEIPSTALVPGDIILLEAGDKIPADARLFETANLQVDEASLTGENQNHYQEVLELFQQQSNWGFSLFGYKFVGSEFPESAYSFIFIQSKKVGL